MNVPFTEITTDPKDILDLADHMRSARALVEKRFIRDGLRTLHRYRGTFWSWMGSHYQIVDDEEIRSQIWDFLDLARTSVTDKKGNAHILPYHPNKTKVENVHAALISVCQLNEKHDPPMWLGDDPKRKYPADELFSCRNGLLHLPTGKRLPPTPAYFGITASNVEFNPKAPPPKKWKQFLADTIVDKEGISVLQEIFGYLLSPDMSQQKIFLCVGPKRSGKGTMARLVTQLVGNEAVTGPTMTSLGETFGLEPLITSSLAIISDARIGAKTDKANITERLLKISGQDKDTFGRKYKAAWSGRLPTRIMILTNDLPALSDGSGALAGRYIITLFKVSFYGREDPKLLEKLLPELSGILNWAIEGYRRLNKRGHFIQPKNARDVMDAIEALGAPVKAFLRDRCIVAPGQSVPLDELYRVYEDWCRVSGQRLSNKEWFARELRSAIPGLDTQRPRMKRKGEAETKETRPVLYQGVGLAPGVAERM